MVPFLIERGAFINDKDFNGFTPIAKAALAVERVTNWAAGGCYGSRAHGRVAA